MTLIHSRISSACKPTILLNLCLDFVVNLKIFHASFSGQQDGFRLGNYTRQPIPNLNKLGAFRLLEDDVLIGGLEKRNCADWLKQSSTIGLIPLGNRSFHILVMLVINRSLKFLFKTVSTSRIKHTGCIKKIPKSIEITHDNFIVRIRMAKLSV